MDNGEDLEFSYDPPFIPIKTSKRYRVVDKTYEEKQRTSGKKFTGEKLSRRKHYTDIVKGAWSEEEDEIVKSLVNKLGPKHWSIISSYLPGRIGKQCRERWHNHLNPDIKHHSWSPEEDIKIINAHLKLGNR